MHNKFVLVNNMFIDAGIGLIFPVTTLFIHTDLHKSLVTASYVLLAYSVCMALGDLVGGFLFDNKKKKPLMCFAAGNTILSMFFLIFFHFWPVYVFFICWYGLALGILYCAINAYIAFLQKKDRNIFNNAYWAGNTGMGLATFISGVLYAQDVRWVFIAAMIMFGGVFFLVYKEFDFNEMESSLYRTRRYLRPASNPRISSKKMLPIILICLDMAIIWLGYEQWNSNVSILMTNKGISIEKYSFLFTIGTIVIGIAQPVVVRIFPYNFEGDKLKVVLGTFLFGLSFVLIINTGQYLRFIIGMGLAALGESLALTTMPSLINRFANNTDRGILQSTIGFSGSLGRALGPLFGSYLIGFLGYNFAFMVMIILHLIIILPVGFIKKKSSYN